MDLELLGVVQHLVVDLLEVVGLLLLELLLELGDPETEYIQATDKEQMLQAQLTLKKGQPMQLELLTVLMDLPVEVGFQTVPMDQPVELE